MTTISTSVDTMLCLVKFRATHGLTHRRAAIGQCLLCPRPIASYYKPGKMIGNVKVQIVPKVGFEPTQVYTYTILSRARLPFRHSGNGITILEICDRRNRFIYRLTVQPAKRIIVTAFKRTMQANHGHFCDSFHLETGAEEFV